ncbi:hypothetical protein TKK_0009768 [Trichogramma kaykai]
MASSGHSSLHPRLILEAYGRRQYAQPLTHFSYNASDSFPLTPGHYLIGEPMISIPEPNLAKENIPPLARWTLLSKLRDCFWHRWRKEYLNTLQKRTKWHLPEANLEIDSIVLIIDDNAPPSKWPLGRIIDVTRGRDGIVRVAKLRTATSTITRPAVKLCPLPIKKSKVLPDQ